MYQEFAAYLRDLGDKTDYRLTPDVFRRDGFGEYPAFGCLVAENEREVVVGYLIFRVSYATETARRCLWIVDLFVTANVRGQGVGRLPMEESGKVCKALGGDKLLWSVYRPNTQAQRFYEHIGGRYVKEELYMYLPVG